MPVLDIPQRDVVVTFTNRFASYNEGETAAFTASEADALIAEGFAVAGDVSTGPPVNFNVPHVRQEGDTLTCTMGEWTGSPTAYAYAWEQDGTAVGADASTHTVTAPDAGATFTCTVTATNAHGSTTAPPSNGVVATDPGA